MEDADATSTAPETKTETDETSSWSPRQDILLLNALCRWKPVGMHRHTRMVAISSFVNRYSAWCGPAAATAEAAVSGSDDAERSWLAPPELWSRLDALYNLAELEQRDSLDLYYSDNVVWRRGKCSQPGTLSTDWPNDGDNGHDTSAFNFGAQTAKPFGSREDILAYLDNNFS
ncbi:hypothetical protein RI367_005626 [Sorochytrium milnesiophthora]